METILLFKEILVSLAAFVGMGFGLYNFVNERNKKIVRIKVVPKAVLDRPRTSLGQEMVVTSENEFDTKHSHGLFGVEIVNLSMFPVVINEVGYLVTGEIERISLPLPILGDKGPWPRKLEARDSVTVYGNVNEMLSSPLMPKVHSAFAKTSCGHIGTGSTVALRQLVESAQVGTNPRGEGKKRRSFLASIFGSGHRPR